MKRGHDHPSPHRNGKGNFLSHYSTVVTTPFMAHIECHITLTPLHFVSCLVLIVEYITLHLGFMSGEKQVAEWRLCRPYRPPILVQLKVLVVLSTFGMYTGVIVWKGDLASIVELDGTENLSYSTVLFIHMISCIKKTSQVVSGNQSTSSWSRVSVSDYRSLSQISLSVRKDNVCEKKSRLQV